MDALFFFEFSQRIVKSYPEIYSSTTSEGTSASDYFDKWKWYATLNELAHGNILNFEKILNLNVHEIHTFLAHKIDRAKLEEELRKPNLTRL